MKQFETKRKNKLQTAENQLNHWNDWYNRNNVKANKNRATSYNLNLKTAENILKQTKTNNLKKKKHFEFTKNTWTAKKHVKQPETNQTTWTIATNETNWTTSGKLQQPEPILLSSSKKT